MGQQVDRKLMDQYAERFKNWGRWGPDDELGTLNFVTPNSIMEAVKLVLKGKIFSLAIPFDENGPQFGRKKRLNPYRFMLATGTDAALGRQKNDKELIYSYADDILMTSAHGATHWDALSHKFFEYTDANGKWNSWMYNGIPSESVVDSSGSEKCSIEVTKDKMLGRGVLLDIARYKGCEVLEDGHEITSDDLDGCAEANKITIKQGDFVLIRTGKLGKCLKEGKWGDFIAGDAPGLEFETLEWMYNKKIATIASDTFGVEVLPNRSVEFFQPWHQICIPILGMIHGEMFNLDELAIDCAGDGRYEFLFVAPPLSLTKGAGSAVNPIAIK